MSIRWIRTVKCKWPQMWGRAHVCFHGHNADQNSCRLRIWRESVTPPAAVNYDPYGRQYDAVQAAARSAGQDRHDQSGAHLRDLKSPSGHVPFDSGHTRPGGRRRCWNWQLTPPSRYAGSQGSLIDQRPRDVLTARVRTAVQRGHHDVSFAEANQACSGADRCAGAVRRAGADPNDGLALGADPDRGAVPARRLGRCGRAAGAGRIGTAARRDDRDRESHRRLRQHRQRAGREIAARRQYLAGRVRYPCGQSEPCCRTSRSTTTRISSRSR